MNSPAVSPVSPAESNAVYPMVVEAGHGIPSWMKQPNESWRDWELRRLAEIHAEGERKLSQPPMPLDPLYSGSLDLAAGVGTFDCNGSPKGFGW